MKTINTPTRWNLSKLHDGLDLEKLRKHLDSIKETLTELELDSSSNVIREEEFFTISKLIKQIESAESLYYCLTTENIEPSFLTTLNASISSLKSQVHLIIFNWQETLINMTEKQFDQWSAYIIQKGFISDVLKREIRQENNQGKIVSCFSCETLNGLENIYSQLCNNLKVKVDGIDGENELTFAEAINLAMSHPEDSERLLVFKELNRTLEKQSNDFASIYNQMVGVRLNENKIKNVDYLEESIKLNGISHSTLNTMWDVVDSNVHKLSKFLEVRSRETNKEKLSWHELMSSSQEVPHQIRFSKAVEGITKSLEKIDINMAEFAKNAITKGWVDAEQRNTKPPGGFCAPFVTEGESRISLNYDDSIDSARILAHELGHAWHFQQIKDVPSLRFQKKLLK